MSELARLAARAAFDNRLAICAIILLAVMFTAVNQRLAHNRRRREMWRPRIAVRRETFHQKSTLAEVESEWAIAPTYKYNGDLLPGEPVFGSVEIENLGQDGATGISILGAIYWSAAGLPRRRPYDDAIPVGFDDLPAGRGSPCRDLVSHQAPTRAEADDINGSGATRLYLMGAVTYLDRFNVRRRTRFCRVWDRADQGFRRVDDPDYECAD